MGQKNHINKVPGVLGLLISISTTLLFIGGANGDDANGIYSVGVGIADVTGPAAGIGFMGYASFNQIGKGIQTRLYARSFVIESKTSGERVSYTVAEIGMIDQAIKYEVIKELQMRFGDTYTEKNVLLSATHTHSGPAGYLQYVLYGITSLGFHKSNFKAVVDGIVQSIERAHHDMHDANIFLNKGHLTDASINRSPTAYLANPEEERNKYPRDVDTEMTLLRFETLDGTPLGILNWFPVHPVSMNNTNRLVSSDNKGFAALYFEKAVNPVGTRPGRGKFVAAFASSNLGDVSPNTRGPRCVDTGLPCDLHTSTCGGFTKNCIAFGPGSTMEESTKIIGDRQFKKALELFEDKTGSIMLKGPIQFNHQYVNMSNYEVTLEDENGVSYTVKTCKAAMGYSFAAGTVDGQGMFDFTQGTTTGNAFWDSVRDLLKTPSPEQIECQKPKPILLALGESNLPYEWTASVVVTQVLRLGNLYVLGIPGELTTMAGRRLREVCLSVLPEGSEVVISGLSNVYTHYIATPEEYDVQRYEGASTLFGRHTLDAYINQYPFLLSTMVKGQRNLLEDGPQPPNLLSKQISLIPAVFMDLPPFMKNFGDVIRHPYPLATAGETIKAVFVSGSLRNNPMREGSFFIIEKLDEVSGRWSVERDDSDLDTKLEWYKPFPLSLQSEVEVFWEVPIDQTPGTYRIRHFGYSKPFMKDPRPYQGTTNDFKIRAPASSNNPQGALVVDGEIEMKKSSRVGKSRQNDIITVGDFWRALIKERHEKTNTNNLKNDKVDFEKHNLL